MEKKKIALLFICLNERYWPFLGDVVSDCKERFLTEHQVDYFVWSDMTEDLATKYGAKVFSTDPIEWPYPTLLRYHLFLQQEELLKEYDYVYYLDVDMRVVAPVTEVVFTEGLTMAEHPMYAVSKKFVPPYEPNGQSAAYIPRFGIVIKDPESGNPWFKPLYAAGGFQGGTSTEFIKAMKEMRKNIDSDMNRNYIAVWNDESHWNKYLSQYKGYLQVLSPSFIYPDSLIKEYYEPIWGTNHAKGINVYAPIIVTLTKKFSTTKEGGTALQDTLKELKSLS